MGYLLCIKVIFSVLNQPLKFSKTEGSKHLVYISINLLPFKIIFIN